MPAEALNLKAWKSRRGLSREVKRTSHPFPFVGAAGKEGARYRWLCQDSRSEMLTLDDGG